MWVVGDHDSDLGAGLAIQKDYNVRLVLFSEKDTDLMIKNEKTRAGNVDTSLKTGDIGLAIDHDELQNMIKREIPNKKQLAIS